MTTMEIWKALSNVISHKVQYLSEVLKSLGMYLYKTQYRGRCMRMISSLSSLKFIVLFFYFRNVWATVVNGLQWWNLFPVCCVCF